MCVHESTWKSIYIVLAWLQGKCWLTARCCLAVTSPAKFSAVIVIMWQQRSLIEDLCIIANIFVFIYCAHGACVW